MALIVKLFSEIKGKVPRLKIFITSRPELPIRLGFKATKGAYDKVILHEIDDSVIEHDISVFLAHELEQIRYRYNESVEEQERRLPATWPTQQDSLDLVKMAVPLFISAVTLCLFIADRVGGNPRKKPGKILKDKTRGQRSKLDSMYLIILEQLLAGLSDQDSQEILAQFRKVVGSIVILASPLSPCALARLLDLAMEDVSDLLDLLHSVLNVPSSSKQPVRLLQLSFRDFLLGGKQSEKNPFWIDQKKQHEQLATNCFRILKQSLRNEICGLRHPGTEHSSIDPEKISTMLPDEVQYACEHWAYHLRESGAVVLDGGEVHTFLSEHFLRWLEALGLIRRSTESVNIIRIIQHLMPAKANSPNARFLDDAIRFILAFGPIIHQAPLQVYSSALIFAPQNSAIRLSFKNQIPSWISLQPNTPLNWSSNMQTIEGQTEHVNRIVFSPNSKLVASGSWGKTIKLWGADSGALLQTLEVYSQQIKLFTFSPDGGTLASVSSEGIVRLWDIRTGALLQTRDTQVVIDSAAFSTDLKLLVTGSGDELVRIWVTGTGALDRTLEGRGDKVESVALSSDAKLVAAGSDNQKVWVWKTDTGTLLQVIKAFTDEYAGVCSVSFAPNSKLLASASETGTRDATVRIWDVETGAPLHTLDYNGNINSIAFSPDSKLIASASNSGIIQLRAADTGVMRQLLEGHMMGVLSVAFSPDGKVVASGSEDMTLRLWDVNIEAPVESRSYGSVRSLSLSPDKKTVASASDDHTVRLWDTYSGMLQCTLEGHSAPVFSPDGNTVALGLGDGTVLLSAVDTGAVRHTFKDPGALKHTDNVFGASAPNIEQFTFSPDSKLLALAAWSKILLCAVDTGSLLCYIRSHWFDHIELLVFSPGSKLLASVSQRTIELYSFAPVPESCSNAVEPWSLAIQQTLKGRNSRFLSAVFSPDGRLLASPSDIKTIRLWDTSSGTLERILEGHVETVVLVAFSPDSEIVASASYDETVRLWKSAAF